MARRLRLVLRPAKPNARDSNSFSSPMMSMDMVKYYGNIQPRRPIKNDELTPVDPRPSLEIFRQAHEEANKAMSNKSE